MGLGASLIRHAKFQKHMFGQAVVRATGNSMTVPVVGAVIQACLVALTRGQPIPPAFEDIQERAAKRAKITQLRRMIALYNVWAFQLQD